MKPEGKMKRSEFLKGLLCAFPRSQSKGMAEPGFKYML